MEKKKLVYIKKIEPGCYSSTLDCDTYRQLFEKNGYGLTDNPRKAHVFIIASCVVCSPRETESLRQIERALKFKRRGAQVIVGGCVSDVFREKIAHSGCPIFKTEQISQLAHYQGFADTLEPTLARKNIPAQLFHAQIGKWILFRAVADFVCRISGRIIPGFHYMLKRFLNTTYAYHPRAYLLQCARGCANMCSYCSTKLAIGRIKSRDVRSIIAEARGALESGYNHFILVADDLASYGIDRGENLVPLLTSLEQLPGECTLTLYHFNPTHTLGYFNEFINALVPGKIKCIHYVLQSGSNGILKLMNRNYTKEEFISTARAILEKDSEISLRTDVIVGFPGETETDFADTLDVIRHIPFETLNVNKFDEREGTVASALPGKVPEKVKTRRKREITAFFHKQLFRRWVGLFFKRSAP